jgi:thioredoxin-dependent peroxiredoxin
MISSGFTFRRVAHAALAAAVLSTLTATVLSAQAKPATRPTGRPAVGQRAPGFSLQALDGASVRLETEVARGPVVLVVLRGWPGYQCPFCTRQFGEYLSKAHNVEATGAHVLFVYPGPADSLKAHAEMFVKTATLPAIYRVLLDPDYTFTRAYGLRWDAPNETAYPSTFVLDTGGTVTFTRTSETHGDRVPVADVLAALAKLRK